MFKCIVSMIKPLSDGQLANYAPGITSLRVAGALGTLNFSAITSITLLR